MHASQQALIAATVLLGAWVGAAHAAGAAVVPTVAERIARARVAQEEQEYAVAVLDLQEAIADPRATEAELLEANLLAGMLERIMEHNVEARMHFLWVLRRRPGTQLPPDTPPKIATFFELVRQEAHPELAGSTRLEPGSGSPSAAAGGAPVVPEAPQGAELQWLTLTGGGVAAVAGVVTAGLAVLAASNEATYWDAGAPTVDRARAASTARIAWVAAAGSGLLASAGLGMVIVGELQK